MEVLTSLNGLEIPVHRQTFFSADLGHRGRVFMDGVELTHVITADLEKQEVVVADLPIRLHGNRIVTKKLFGYIEVNPL